MARSQDALDVRLDAWPTGRQRKQAPPQEPAGPPAAPRLPARPLVLRSHRPPPPPPIDLSAPRPPVVDDLELLGLSRLTRSRVGARIYRMAIAALFVLIFVQMLVAMLTA